MSIYIPKISYHTGGTHDQVAIDQCGIRIRPSEYSIHILSPGIVLRNQFELDEAIDMIRKVYHFLDKANGILH